MVAVSDALGFTGITRKQHSLHPFVAYYISGFGRGMPFELHSYIGLSAPRQ